MTVNSPDLSENYYPPTLYHKTHLFFKPCLCLYLGNFCLWHNWITRSGCERWGLFRAFLSFPTEVPANSLWEVHLSFPDVLGKGFQPEWRTPIFGVFEVPASLFSTEKNCAISLSTNLLDAIERWRIGVQLASAASLCFPQQQISVWSLSVRSLGSGYWLCMWNALVIFLALINAYMKGIGTELAACKLRKMMLSCCSSFRCGKLFS